MEAERLPSLEFLMPRPFAVLKGIASRYEAGRCEDKTDRQAWTQNHTQRNSSTQLQFRWEERDVEEGERRLRYGRITHRKKTW